MTTDQVALAALILGGIGLCALAVAAWRLGTIIGERGGVIADALDDATLELSRRRRGRRADTAAMPEVDDQDAEPAETPERPRPTGHRATARPAGGGRR